MMNLIIRRKNKQVSLNRTNKSRASFVPIENSNTKRFKYNLLLRVSKYNNNKFIDLKNICKKIKGVIKLRLDKFDFRVASNASAMWLMNAFVEGLIVNFTVWGLLGWKFNFITIMAWGIAVKQSLDFYWRLRINGTTTTVFKKYE